MDMLAYLTELIKTRREVGIPGLGTIYKKKSPGRYDAETHSFLPPSYILDFSSEVREQSALIDHICKKRNISPDAATYYVDEFSDDIKKQLEQHEEASLYPLGTLYGSADAFNFKPVNDQNFGFDFYGLPPVKEEAILVAEPVETPPYSTEPVIASQEIEQEETIDDSSEHQVTEEQLELENSNADLREVGNETAAEAEQPIIEEAGEEDLVPEIEEVAAVPEEEQPLVPEVQQEEETSATELPTEAEVAAVTETPAVSETNEEEESAEEPVIPHGEEWSEEEDSAEKQETEKYQIEEATIEEIYEVEEENQSLPVADEQPVYEEIAEVELPKKPIEEPIIETVVPTTINDIYAQSNRPPLYEPRPTPVQPEQPVESEQVTEPRFYNSDGEYTEPAKTPVYLKILIALLLILIGLAAAYFIRPDLFDPILKRGENQATAPLENGVSGQAAALTADSLAKADSAKRNIEKTLPIKDSTKKDSSTGAKPVAAKPVATKAETAVVPPATKALPTPPPVAETGTTYEVIGSSVTSQKEADRFIANMKSLGITAKAIPPAPGRKIIKLSIGSFKDYNTAHSERPKLEKKLGIKDTYIHTNKPL